MDAKTRTHIKLVKTAMLIADAYYKTIASKNDLKRYNNMIKYINSEIAKIKGESDVNYDDGILGRVIELFCRDSASTLTEVRTQGKCDAYIPTTDGKRVKAEIKTNGGQVHELMKMSRRQQESTFMIYFSHTAIPQSTAAKKANKPISYYDCFKIMSVAEFLENGTFRPNKSKNAINVQPTSKIMYERLEVFADFKRNTAYNI